MSRTTRNRNTTPKGWTVRDDGRPYFHGRSLPRDQVPRYRRPWCRCETTAERRLSTRMYRARVRSLMAQGIYILPHPRRTSGWLSW